MVLGREDTDTPLIKDMVAERKLSMPLQDVSYSLVWIISRSFLVVVAFSLCTMKWTIRRIPLMMDVAFSAHLCDEWLLIGLMTKL